MPRIYAIESAAIAVPADRVYAIIADYHNGHPRIVPPKFFRDMKVERGGVGAGTVVRFTMTVMGATRELRAEITEPQPGRVLVETYPDSGEVTTFTVEPTAAGCTVRIETEWTRGGIGGLMQRLFIPPMLRRIYREELKNLARVAAEPGS